jgi:hypothetical protein
MKNRRTTIVALLGTTLAFAGVAAGGEFSTMGDYVMHRQVKITGSGKVLEIPMKPLPLRVETDGVTVRVSTSAENDNWSTFTIYRSDGIGRQNTAGGPLEVVPGVQATSDTGGVHKHLRLTQDTLTLTVFPGVSDQTVITHARLAPPPSLNKQPAADARAEQADP